VQAAFLVSATYSGRNPLGSPTNQARSRFARRLPIVAAPALVGAAAAFALANASAFGGAPSATRPLGHHSVVQAAARTAVRPAARLTSTTRSAVRHGSVAKHSNRAREVSYTVKSGDTLSAIAGHLYRDSSYWPVLYWANHNQVHYANDIQVGQVLTVPVKPAHIPGSPTVLAPAPAPSAAGTSVPAGEQTSTSAQAAPVQEAAPVAATPVQSTAVSTAGDGSFQSCVIERESGGNSQVMNSSGHYGLYQFSASTWAEYGGNPADFGNASAAEQHQVFDNAMAAGGASNWSAYDGC
jgi:LysM repeat protein